MAKGIYKNDGEVPLSVAVWLANNEYDFTPTVNSLSTTDLLKSTRQLVLRNRRMQVEAVEGVQAESLDIMRLVASKMGTAIHDSIEQSWRQNAKNSLIALGYPARVADMVTINPDPEDVDEDMIPVYMEIRGYKEIEGYTISGKFDFCIEGKLEDFKSTSTFTFTNNTGEDKYVKQGSIYRWIHDDIVTDDVFSINYIFTDWSAAMARASKGNYPKQRIVQANYNLMSVAETEAFIRGKLRNVKAHLETPEPDLPDCTSEELWQKEPVYKYYKNPATAQKGGRSTKNFDSMAAALQRKSDDGNIGVVVEKPGEVVACKYCDEFDSCTQKDRLIAAGLLNME